MPTVLSITLAVAAQQRAKHKAIVTRITAIEELAGVAILCSDKTIRSPRTSLPLIY
jgi:H+-transporting ATPase